MRKIAAPIGLGHFPSAPVPKSSPNTLHNPLSRLHRALHQAALWHPEAPRDSWVTVLFRRRFFLKQEVRSAAIHLTASQRFALYLDGVLIARGPARSDSDRWQTPCIRLPKMSRGGHLLAVSVFYPGQFGGESETGPTAFLFVADDKPGLDIAGKAGEWACWHDKARKPAPRLSKEGALRHSVLCRGEALDAAKHPWAWEMPGFDDSKWVPAVALPTAADTWGNLPLNCRLYPASIPPMAESPIPWTRCAEAPPDLAAEAQSFAIHQTPLRIPARRRVRFVLDCGSVTNAWIHLNFSGGRGAKIQTIACEAPLGADGKKGDRNATAGCTFPGHVDELHCDGGANRQLAPLAFRPFRYLVIHIRTFDEELILQSATLTESAFPLRRSLQFKAGKDWEPLLDVSWRTIRMCAHDLIFDCPHFEQCQFPGDTRVQAICHYLMANDDRLVRKAIADFAASRRFDGRLLCRWPARKAQRIDTFTLHWVCLLDEFLLWRGDRAFLAPFLGVARAAIESFLALRRPDGLLNGDLVAPFLDWSPGLDKGNAPQDADGGSAPIALLLAQACTALARMENEAGFPELAPRWQLESDRLCRAVCSVCMDKTAGILLDTPVGKTLSVHTQVEAILAGARRPAAALQSLRAALANPQAAQPGTRYYTWHLARAFLSLGKPADALALIAGWNQQLAASPGITTWPESDRNPRSDCHGWSCYPILAAASVVLGVRPAAPGFERIHFHPFPDEESAAEGRIVTPSGTIRIQTERRGPQRIESVLETPVPALLTDGTMLAPGVHRVVSKS